MTLFTFYRIKVGDHVYIGSTQDIENRSYKHNRDLHNQDKMTIRLYSVANELGIDELELEKLEEIEYGEVVEARKRELQLMRQHNADLNMRKPYEPRDEFLKRKAKNQRAYYYRKRALEKEMLEIDIDVTAQSADDNEIIGESVELSN